MAKLISISQLLGSGRSPSLTINKALSTKKYKWSSAFGYELLSRDIQYNRYISVSQGSFNVLEKFYSVEGISAQKFNYDTSTEKGISSDNLIKNIFYYVKQLDIYGSSKLSDVYLILRPDYSPKYVKLGQEYEYLDFIVGVKTIESFMNIYGNINIGSLPIEYDLSKIYIKVDNIQDEQPEKPVQDLYAIPTYTRSFSKGSSSAYTNPSNVDLSIANPFNCTLNVYHGGSLSKSLVIPVYPNEVSENNSVSFSPTPVLNRSVAYQTYSTSGRTLSFDLDLHEEIVAHNIKDKSNLDAIYNYIHYFVSVVQSAAYPNYLEHGYTDPPEISVSIGDQFYIRGILDSCSANWKAPIIDKRLVDCSLSLGIKETTGPYTGAEVAKMMGRRL